jgi:uncharacterized membrane protein (UPF0182 family)
MTFSDVKFEIPKFTSMAKTHLFILGGLFFVLLGINFRLRAFDVLLSSRSETFFGPGFTDLTVTLPVLQFLTYLSLLAAGSMVLNVWLKKPWISAGLVALIFAVQILGLGLYAGVVQEYRVRPNEISRETPFIENNIKFTSMAFDLEDVTASLFELNNTLTSEDLSKNELTIKNIRLWDPRPLKDTYSQLQEIRLYYDFNDVDVDRYKINDTFVEVMISAREIESSGLPTSAQNWINEHLVYTHGYGVVASRVNIVTKEGLPELFVKDIPPSSEVFDIQRAEIYFGEKTVDYVIVKTTTDEFDYPSGDENKYATYQGDSGVQLNSIIKKLAMSFYFGTPKIYLSNDITPESRVLFNRDIRTITRKITPFLTYDQDPYIVSSEGRLFWIMDGYTTSSGYPYSTPHSGVNYIRNPVKVVIDAYTGETTFYVIDTSDPIIQTYATIFPELFKPISQMSDDLKSHLRYPEDMFSLQSSAYTRYHMKDPRVFYNLEDMWNVPNELYDNKRIKMDPYYIIMKLPGEEKEEFILMLPFTPRNKDNMIAWMYARSDPENYGKLGVFKFPKQELIFGPMQLEARIDQDSKISEQLTLWGQVGSRVIRGNLLVIPVENSILYVEPLYLLADQSQLPELKRVIVAYDEKIVMEENLETALSTLFGAYEEISTTPVEPGSPPDGLAGEAMTHYNSAVNALKMGDWEEFGRELDALERILTQLNEVNES